MDQRHAALADGVVKLMQKQPTCRHWHQGLRRHQQLHMCPSSGSDPTRTTSADEVVMLMQKQPIWWHWHQELRRYQQLHGHAYVPQQWERPNADIFS